MTDKENETQELELEAIDKGPAKHICPICGHRQFELPDCELCGQAIMPKKSYRSYWVIALLLLIVTALFIFILRDDQGNAIISLDENNIPQFTTPDLSASTKKAKYWVNEGKSLSGDQAVIHKWQDENGVWQYSQQAPAKSDNVQVIKIDPDTNVVPHNK